MYLSQYPSAIFVTTLRGRYFENLLSIERENNEKRNHATAGLPLALPLSLYWSCALLRLGVVVFVNAREYEQVLSSSSSSSVLHFREESKHQHLEQSVRVPGRGVDVRALRARFPSERDEAGVKQHCCREIRRF